MISEDEYLERVVAGIHAISSDDDDVHWNEKINGRQLTLSSVSARHPELSGRGGGQKPLERASAADVEASRRALRSVDGGLDDVRDVFSGR